jgi:hypothetical protein
MRSRAAFAVLVTIFFTYTALSSAQTARYFKAEHGLSATYVNLRSDGSYEVIDREHVGSLLAEEGHWVQTGTVITFSPKDAGRSSYRATENEYKGKTFLAIRSPNAAAGIDISVKNIKKKIDADPGLLPNHALFKITASRYKTETKEDYPLIIGETSLSHRLFHPRILAQCRR